MVFAQLSKNRENACIEARRYQLAEQRLTRRLHVRVGLHPGDLAVLDPRDHRGVLLDLDAAGGATAGEARADHQTVAAARSASHDSFAPRDASRPWLERPCRCP